MERCKSRLTARRLPSGSRGAPNPRAYRWAFVATGEGLFSEQKFNCPTRRPPYLQFVGGTPIQEIRTSRPDQLGDSAMKKLSIITVAILLGLSGVAMAG